MDLEARRRRRELVAEGIGAWGFRTPLLRRTGHGFYTVAGEEPTAAMTRIRDAAAMLPGGGALAGWAAAHVLGARVLDGRSAGDGRLLPVPVVVPVTSRMRRRQGLDVGRDHLDDADRTLVDGLVVTAPARTAFDLARFGALEDAVAAVDAALATPAFVDVDLTASVARHGGWRGVPQARCVDGLSDPRAASPPESRMRVLWIVEAGLPRPLVNHEVRSTAGAFLGIPDLLDEESGLAGEYDGAGHRDRRQHGLDNAREELLEHHGLTVVRAVSTDLGSGRRSFLWRLRSGYERAQRQRRRSWRLG